MVCVERRASLLLQDIVWSRSWRCDWHYWLHDIHSSGNKETIVSIDKAYGTRENGQFPYYVSGIQLPEYFAVFSFSCKHWVPKTNGKTIAPINITNKISKGILVVVFSRCIRGTGHYGKQSGFHGSILLSGFSTNTRAHFSKVRRDRRKPRKSWSCRTSFSKRWRLWNLSTGRGT